MKLDHVEHSEHLGRVTLLAVREVLGMEGDAPRAVGMFVRDCAHLIPTAEMIAIQLEVANDLKHGHVPDSTEDMWLGLVEQIGEELEDRADYYGTRGLAKARLEDIMVDGKVRCPHCGNSAIRGRLTPANVHMRCTKCHWHGRYPVEEYRALKLLGKDGESA